MSKYSSQLLLGVGAAWQNAIWDKSIVTSSILTIEKDNWFSILNISVALEESLNIILSSSNSILIISSSGMIKDTDIWFIFRLVILKVKNKHYIHMPCLLEI